MPQFTQAQIEARTELSRKQFESGYNVVKNNRPMSYSASIRFLTPEDSNKYRYLYLIEGILGVIDNKTLALRTQTVVDILPIICGFMAAQGMKIGHLWMSHSAGGMAPTFEPVIEFSREEPPENLGIIFTLDEINAYLAWDTADEYLYTCSLRRRVFHAVTNPIQDELNRLAKLTSRLGHFTADTVTMDGEICRRIDESDPTSCLALRLEEGNLTLYVNDVLKAVGPEALRIYMF